MSLAARPARPGAGRAASASAAAGPAAHVPRQAPLFGGSLRRRAASCGAAARVVLPAPAGRPWRRGRRDTLAPRGRSRTERLHLVRQLRGRSPAGAARWRVCAAGSGTGARPGGRPPRLGTLLLSFGFQLPLYRAALCGLGAASPALPDQVLSPDEPLRRPPGGSGGSGSGQTPPRPSRGIAAGRRARALCDRLGGGSAPGGPIALWAQRMAGPESLPFAEAFRSMLRGDALVGILSVLAVGARAALAVRHGCRGLSPGLPGAALRARLGPAALRLGADGGARARAHSRGTLARTGTALHALFSEAAAAIARAGISAQAPRIGTAREGPAGAPDPVDRRSLRRPLSLRDRSRRIVRLLQPRGGRGRGGIRSGRTGSPAAALRRPVGARAGGRVVSALSPLDRPLDRPGAAGALRDPESAPGAALGRPRAPAQVALGHPGAGSFGEVRAGDGHCPSGPRRRRCVGSRLDGTGAGRRRSCGVRSTLASKPPRPGT